MLPILPGDLFHFGLGGGVGVELVLLGFVVRIGSVAHEEEGLRRPGHGRHADVVVGGLALGHDLGPGGLRGCVGGAVARLHLLADELDEGGRRHGALAQEGSGQQERKPRDQWGNEWILHGGPPPGGGPEGSRVADSIPVK